ncbi:MAG: calcium/proton exchanger [Methylococcus sp.]
MHWLYPFVPLAFVMAFGSGYRAELKFLVSALAFIPLAKLMVAATEQIAQRTNVALGAMLNATFGNAPELIISLVALREGMIELVKASIVGVILGNLLFVVGLSFLIGGLRHGDQKFNRRGARVQRSELMIAAISIVLPSLFSHYISTDNATLEQALNTSVAIVLMGTYGLGLIFMLKTHPHYFEPKNPVEEGDSQAWPVLTALLVLGLSSVLLALLSEILVGSVEETARSLGLSKAFIGIVIVALIGGAPESVAAVAMARQDKLDLTMGIAVGSSLQIALFVAPLLVLSSYLISPHPFDLVVGNAAVMLVLLPVLIFSMIVTDGKANWFKGVQLLSVYLLIALFCFFLPDNSPALFLAR